MKWLKVVFWCWLMNSPKSPRMIRSGHFNGRGDYGDQWGKCRRCGGQTHRDAHLFGDGIWRHDRGR